MKTKVEFNVKLPFKIKKRKKWFLASCPILDVYSQGETEEKAKKNLIEALSLFLISCFERGVLDQALKSCGFKGGYGIPPQRMSSRKTQDFVNVPIPFQVNQSPGSECRV